MVRRTGKVRLLLALMSSMMMATTMIMCVPAVPAYAANENSNEVDAPVIDSAEDAESVGSGGSSKNESSGGGEAEGEEQHYMTDINPDKLFEQDGTDDGSNSTILSAGISMLRLIMNAIALPVSILLCIWRVVYLAAFPMMMNIDPLHMTEQKLKGRKRAGIFAGGRVGRAGRTFENINTDAWHTSTYEKMSDMAHEMIKSEVIDMGIGLIIVAAFWSIFQLIFWGVEVFVGLWV